MLSCSWYGANVYSSYYKHHIICDIIINKDFFFLVVVEFEHDEHVFY